MKEALLRAFSLGCKVTLEMDLNQCYIEVVHVKTINSRAQYLPLDDHLNYALPGCIDFCVKALLQDIENKEIEN